MHKDIGAKITQPTIEKARPAAQPVEDEIAQIERLIALRDKGAITEQEFQKEKKKILGSP